uniref:Uncharacterized protein n=1 Tax=Rangifer tarandus platyrhynchus TaxID=3082113 RepID=A0ACB0EC43_RANTA|nr:unnamed protein product [Rangifer tarandus platyrhynchus]
MADPKYADLPGVARNEPDVYETSDLPEDDQAEFDAEELTTGCPEAAAGCFPSGEAAGTRCRNLTDPDGALAKRLLLQLKATKNSKGTGSGGKTTSGSPPDSSLVTYELHSRPEQHKFSQAAKVAELEKHLTELEATVRCDQDAQNPLSAGLQGACLMDTVELLQAKVGALDLAVLDQVEARLQSVLGKVNEIAKHKASGEDADTQSKVHQLYETMQRWSPIATSLPELVQRLVTIKQLHEQAMQFGQLLTHLDTTQQMIACSLKDSAALLTQVQTTMRENLSTIEGNFASIDERIKKLGK